MTPQEQQKALREKYHDEYLKAYNICVRRSNEYGGGIGEYEDDALEEVKPVGVDDREFKTGFSLFVCWLMD